MEDKSPGQPIQSSAVSHHLPTSATSEPSISKGHNLLTIPPEILEAIAKEADPRGLKNLRLVCREVAAIIGKVYLEVLFTKRAFLLGSKSSMATLKQLSEHEVYGTKLRKLVLCVDHIKRRKNMIYWSVWLERRTDALSVSEQAQKDRDLAWFNDYEFRRKNGPEDSLLEVFSNLKKHGNSNVELEITQALMTSYFIKDYKYGWMTDRWDRDTGSEIEYFESLFRSLINSGIQLRCFKANGKNYAMGALDVWWIVDFTNWLWADNLLELAKTAFGSVQELHLSSRVTSGVISLDAPEFNFDGVIDTFANSSNLQTLVLRVGTTRSFPYVACASNPINEPLGHSVLIANFPALKCLTLDGFTLRCPSFIEFLGRHQKLEHCNLVNDCITRVSRVLNSSLADYGSQWTCNPEHDDEILIGILQKHTNEAVFDVEGCRMIDEDPCDLPDKEISSDDDEDEDEDEDNESYMGSDGRGSEGCPCPGCAPWRHVGEDTPEHEDEENDQDENEDGDEVAAQDQDAQDDDAHSFDSDSVDSNGWPKHYMPDPPEHYPDDEEESDEDTEVWPRGYQN